MKSITAIAAITGIIIVFLVHGTTDGIALYNASPLILSLIPMVFLRSTARERQYAVYGFSWTVICLPTIMHVLWAAGANSSSTGGIMFVFLPIFTILAACVAGAVGTAIGFISEFRNRRRPNQAL